MSARVHSNRITRLLDEIMAMANLPAPYRLHRLVASMTGMHPTTVMRYHQGKLASADVRVLDCLDEIRDRISKGEDLFPDTGTDPEEKWGPGPAGGTYSSGTVRRWYARVMEALEDPEPSCVHSWVAEYLDMPRGEVEGYLQTGCWSTPHAVIEALRELHASLLRDEAVVFRPDGRDGGALVPRRSVVTLLDEIDKLGVFDAAGDVCSTLEPILELPCGMLSLVRDGACPPLVSLDLYLRIRRILDLAVYDPCRHYRVGDRLWSPVFGGGCVLDKPHKGRMLVEFEGGHRHLMCEDVRIDPRVRAMAP